MSGIDRFLVLISLMFVLAQPSLADQRRPAKAGMLVQAGALEPDGGMGNPHATLAYTWAASEYGAGWLEFGTWSLRRCATDIGERPDPFPPGAPIVADPRGMISSQVFEISTGIILSPPTETVVPYLRVGAGFYRQDAYYTDSYSWAPGMSIGTGFRFDFPKPLPAPSFEARWHLTRFDGMEDRSFLAISAGLWLR